MVDVAVSQIQERFQQCTVEQCVDGHVSHLVVDVVVPQIMESRGVDSAAICECAVRSQMLCELSRVTVSLRSEITRGFVNSSSEHVEVCVVRVAADNVVARSFLKGISPSLCSAGRSLNRLTANGMHGFSSSEICPSPPCCATVCGSRA